MIYGTPSIVTDGLVLYLDPSNQSKQAIRNLYDGSTTFFGWGASNCQITASADIAPDGTNTAYAMTITNSAGLVRYTAQSFTSSVVGDYYTFSCYFKNNNCTANNLNLGIYDSLQSSIGVEPSYIIQNGFTPASGFSISRISRSENVENGWYRVSVSAFLTPSIHSFSTFIDIENGLGGSKVNGESILLWGPQFEVGSAPTPYQPTSGLFSRVIPDLSGNNTICRFNGGARGTITQNNGRASSISLLGNVANAAGTIYLSGSNNLNISGSNMSGEVWVKFKTLDYISNTGSLMMFYKKGNPDSISPNSGSWFGYDNRSNRNSFAFTCFGNTNGGVVGGGNNFSGFNYTFTNEVWNYIAFTINNNVGSLYINGIKKGPDKIFTNLNLYDTTNPGSGYGDFNANPITPNIFEIGNLKIYNRALSQAEITQNYNAMKGRFNLN